MILFDTETTGLLGVDGNPQELQPYIVEVYAMRLTKTMEVTNELHIRMKPPIKIPEETTKIHGITNDDVKDCKPFVFHWRKIAHFFEGSRYLAGHNLQYDKKVLFNELNRIDKVTNFPWPMRNLCTVEETVKWKGHRLSLTDLHTEIFGRAFDKAHSAKADVEATRVILKWMLENNVTKLVDEEW